ncbi:Papain family cysteine protease [Bradyrhizobium brasilense]|uniref:Papain family cysteine protease n=1 Tax=Bradyrhizobium brasilense TaxID=1419277 RepID=A0A1G7F898_9BRAD|nr:C1 family peptidase [Bradyrhizobium brasilense]SDE72180.1 Papain family cysteine protease [Bradyrhizobium brasilense]
MIAIHADLRTRLHPVRQQGRRQSCLAFATSTAHEHRAGIASHLSVEYLFYHSVERTPGKNPAVGTTIAAAAGALADEGQPIEAAWPYNSVQVTPWTPPAITTTLHKRRMVLGNIGFDDITATLDAGHLVVLGVIITDTFYRPDALGRVADVSPDIERGGHAVLAAGHGVHADGTPMILIRNSWGTGWGIGGYGWLSRSYITRQLRETATLT